MSDVFLKGVWGKGEKGRGKQEDINCKTVLMCLFACCRERVETQIQSTQKKSESTKMEVRPLILFSLPSKLAELNLIHRKTPDTNTLPSLFLIDLPAPNQAPAAAINHSCQLGMITGKSPFLIYLSYGFMSLYSALCVSTCVGDFSDSGLIEPFALFSRHAGHGM